ncbi:MAG: DUF924 family protein [Ghiorsea sp.]|nr:DUF924 family protein [Ghiorsea sp.]MDQ7056963.1 DUF924 family protein [Ghiorsea sp.]
METHVTALDILNFWFEELEPKQWFMKDMALDKTMTKRFYTTHDAAIAGELYLWRETAEGRLAEIIVLDQFSRNMFRDTPKAFASDTLALILAQEAIRQGDDQRIDIEQRAFMYMPYMHSESAMIHEQAEQLFSQAGAEYNYEFELKHKAIIDQFGRYPHRNEILGRTSTPEEIAFLKQPNTSF